MIANRAVSTALRFSMPCFGFSTKKKQMELTIRTPYQTITKDFTGFSRIITKTQESTLVIQNKMPAALHVLPPGSLRLKLTQDVKGLAEEYLHTGGWLIVHTDNTCEVNLMDAFDKKEVKADQIGKNDIKDPDTAAGKYMGKGRKATNKVFAKRASQ